MVFYLLCKVSVFLILLYAALQTDGKTALNIKQQELVTVEAGQSVNITCSFVYESPSFIVKWTRGYNHSVSLTDQTCYNGRIYQSDEDPINIITDSGTLCCERSFTLTIANVTENDSAMYFCNIQTVRGHIGSGSGTRLEVTPRLYIADQPTSMQTYVLYAVIGAETILILVLLTVVGKYCLKGSPKTENQVFKEDLEYETKLHYAEICQANQPQRAKARLPAERVTYAPVKTRQYTNPS